MSIQKSLFAVTDGDGSATLQRRSTKPIGMLAFSAILATAALTTIAYGQSANQGGAYVYWNPIYPTPAYDTYQWTMTVAQLPTVQTYYYWAVQNGFVGGDAFYMGLQPYGSCGITNAGNCEIALFSFFGSGASSASPNCASGADGGPGESCRIAYNWVIGRQYKLLATLTADDGTLETWTGTVTDTTTGVQTTIGSWNIPASDGLIGAQGVSFTEYYGLYNGGCSAEPYAEVNWNVPIGYSKGQAYPGSVRSTSSTTGCSTNARFTTNPSSVTVQTGYDGFLGPVISTPSISALTNSAIPAIDYPPSAPVYLAPRSMATIFGNNLASTTTSASAPWPQSLGGVEVHVVNGPTFPCQGCDFVADLLYVSPTQINFVIPEVNGPAFDPSRIVLVRDGVVFDLWSCNAYGCPPGNIYVNSLYYDEAVFQVGYECLFSFSLADPAACGVSWSQGPNRAPIAAVTDLSGSLISSQNPVHQGQTIVLWLTGLAGLTTDAKTGLLELARPPVVSFGVAQKGTDIPSTVGVGWGWGNAYGEIGLFQTLALWAGESPSFVGLDQINLNFPTCSTNAKASSESRYDAFMTFTSAETQAATTVRLYLPFSIPVGDPACVW